MRDDVFTLHYLVANTSLSDCIDLFFPQLILISAITYYHRSPIHIISYTILKKDDEQ